MITKKCKDGKERHYKTDVLDFDCISFEVLYNQQMEAINKDQENY